MRYPSLVIFFLSLFFFIFLHSLKEELISRTSTTFPVSTKIAAMTASVADHLREHQEESIVAPASTMELSSSSRDHFTCPKENLCSFTSRDAQMSSSSSRTLAFSSIILVWSAQAFLLKGANPRKLKTLMLPSGHNQQFLALEILPD